MVRINRYCFAPIKIGGNLTFNSNIS